MARLYSRWLVGFNKYQNVNVNNELVYVDDV